MNFRKLYQVFSSLPHREKLFIVILGVVFVTSLTQYFVLRSRVNLDGDENTYIEGMIGHVKYLNPVFADYNDTDRDLDELIFSGLIRYDPVSQNFFPDLAESFERSTDGKQITFTLRANAKWHDGQPVTADDILYTFGDVIENPGFKNPVLRTAFDGVVVESSDPLHVRFTMPKPNSYFISQLTVGILPKHILGTIAIADIENSSFNKNPIGTGPYKVVTAVLNNGNDSISLRRFEDFYGDKPQIESLRIITFSNVKDLESELAALKGVSKLKSNDPLIPKINALNTYNINTYSLNQFTAIYFNTQNELLNDSKVRNALTRGIQKTKLVGPGEKRIDTILLEAKPTDANFVYDLAKAQIDLTAAGFTKNADGALMSPKGVKVVLPLLTLDKVGDELPTKIALQFKELGIEVPIRIVPESEFTDAVNSRDYALLLIRQNLGYNRDAYPLFHSSQALSVGKTGGEGDGGDSLHSASATAGLNFSNFKSFPTDGITEAIRKEDDPRSKQKLLNQLSETLATEAPVIFISTPEYIYALDKSIAPFPPSALDFHSDRLTVLSGLSVNH